MPGSDVGPKRDFEVIEGGPDLDITDHVDEDSPQAAALTEMKRPKKLLAVPVRCENVNQECMSAMQSFF